MKHRGIIGALVKLYKEVTPLGARLIFILFLLSPYFALVIIRRIFTSPSVIFACMTFFLSLMGLAIGIYIVLYIISKDKGSHAMREVSGPIKEGSEGYFKGQYNSIIKYTIAVGVLICLVYLLKGDTDMSQGLSKNTIAILTGFSFVIGAILSAYTGYIGIWVSVRANIRVTNAARKCYNEAFQICFRGGAFTAIVNVALAVLGISALFLLTYFLYWMHQPVPSQVPIEKIPLLLVGFGFGASFVAMFAQLGGGIYTKAADVGADLIGKQNLGIPEDDARNPAVIADLVGDNVGDCAGQCADLFESISAEIISAMILGGSLVEKAQLTNEVKTGFVLFPLAVHCLDIVVSTIGVFLAKTKEGVPELKADVNNLEDPLTIMKRGYMATLILATLGFFALCRSAFYIESHPDNWLNFGMSGLVGIVIALVFIFITQYYTDYNYDPVKRIAQSSQSGHATNIITGLSVGMESTGVPVVVISAGIIASYYFGKACEFPALPSGENIAGLFSTAIATMGMFSTGVYVLSMSGFGPIADNAGGIAEMSRQHANVRAITDRLDAVGNVTKANTKGYSVGSASLACFLLFSAFMDDVSILAKQPFAVIDIATPEVYIGGLLGSVTVFLFTSWAISAVGVAAADVILEVKRQFRADPLILEFRSKPNYKHCVEIVAKAGQREMVKPGLLSIIAPIVIGLLFRIIGTYQNRPLLGAQVIAGYLMFATATGILMALFLNNGGGAWDNAKKYIERGMLGGRGSEAHRASVTGDTVGDPCKDTAGPSIHILIKLLSTITLVAVPLFVATQILFIQNY
eukprot:TRINITY_DN2154_c0_g1_i2.p1 TRINITY_DN2154_c0_g1~~TRINITY_DN2154_c0_g1_i2.p1  ORF type:complete len:846 (+),score=39.47 TRINITY_DN2154_c0_g1_i2:128-2539(+)